MLVSDMDDFLVTDRLLPMCDILDLSVVFSGIVLWPLL